MPRQRSFGLTILFGIVMILLTIFLTGAKKVYAQTNAQETVKVANEAVQNGARFAIYLVKHPPSEPYTLLAEKTALADLLLEEKPILTEEDIDSYRISPEGRHFIKLKPGIKVRILPSPPGGVVLDQGFVIVADGIRIYRGDFSSPISNYMPMDPVVSVPLTSPGSAAELQTDIEIGPAPIRPAPKDLRADPRILKVLQDIGKLDTEPNAGGWGESFQSVRARLTADKPTWRQGDEPSFKVEIQNGGNNVLQIATGPNAYRTFVDGVLFEASGAPFNPLNPGNLYQSAIILKPGIWRSQGKLLDLKPGKHAIQVMIDSIASQYGSLRFLSNPVEIEILPADANK
jgi:hypothetical protein